MRVSYSKDVQLFQRRFGMASLLLLLLLQKVAAREWEDVVAVDIYARGNVDIARIQGALEEDPLDEREMVPGKAPAPAPALAPVPAPTVPESDVDQSSPPSDMPSTVPSVYYDGDSVRPPECPPGANVYKINMLDSFGSGWRGTAMGLRQMEDKVDDEAIQVEEASETPPQSYLDTIASTADFERTQRVSKNIVLGESARGGDRRNLSYIRIGGLGSGLSGAQFICLFDSKCYEAVVEGVEEEEVRWEILPSDKDGEEGWSSLPLASGLAPSNCTFPTINNSADSNAADACPSTCHDEKRASSEQGETIQFNGESGAPSDFPSLVPSMYPTPEPEGKTIKYNYE